MTTRNSQAHSTASFSSAPSRSSAGIAASSSAPATTPGSSLHRQPSTMSVDMPVATSSVVNKTASSSASLYQNCLTARALIRRVPGFEEGPWVGAATGGNPAVDPRTPNTPSTPSAHLDPVSQMLGILRLGSSLCYLFNAILMEPRAPVDVSSLPPLPPGKTWETVKKVQINWQPDRDDLQACKRSAAWFVMALKTELGWGTSEDQAAGNEAIMVNMIYDQNTNATVKVISTVLRLLNLLGALGVLMPPSPEDDGALNEATGGALDDRGKVVREILESERKYVQDLEVLQNYQRALIQNEVLPANRIHDLFMNLDGLVDFQRRFLIGVEANARLPGDEQRFGHLFATMEEHFACYEPFCANFASASQLAQDENAVLMTMNSVLDPNYELPTFLIKPVQRICKYPLLLQQLVKVTPPTSQYYEELCKGLASITRVTDAVNETTRQRENELAVNDLRDRVEDWKGHDVNSFGSLVLEDTFMVIKNESEREYHVYLFERIILCCKEVGVKPDKKASKSNSILKKPMPAKRKTTLQLKGRIFINNVLSAVPKTANGQWLLQVTWRGDTAEEFFSIKCRTEEQLKKWQEAIQKAVEEGPERRRRQQAHLSNSSRNRINSPLSQFPNTPQSEMGPQLPNSAGFHYSYGQANGMAHPYSVRNSVEEDDGVYPSDYEPSGGRTTPSSAARRRPSGHRSMPASERSDGYPGNRARSNTEDQTSTTVQHWRSQTPTSMPPIPRGVSMTSEGSVSASGSYNSQVPSLRSSTSSRNLRHKQSHEWGSAGFTRIEDDRSGLLARQGSQASLPMAQYPTPLMRSRSASSPNIYQVDGSQNLQWGGIPSVPPLSIDQRQRSYTNGSGHAKRSSGSSAGTDRSSDDSGNSQTRTGTAASSPASTTVTGSLPNSARLTNSNGRYSNGTTNGAPAGSSVRFKLRAGDDAYVIVALPTISYAELVEKVVKKLRNCGVNKTAEGVRMRYEDEENDKILISADDDIAMAIDWMRQTGSPTITLYVD